jgi:hypothetical protein
LKNVHLIGVEVDNLGNDNFIPIDVFTAVISLLNLSPGHFAINGDAMGARLGTEEPPFNSIEGHVARVVYGKKKASPFSRESPQLQEY